MSIKNKISMFLHSTETQKENATINSAHIEKYRRRCCVLFEFSAERIYFIFHSLWHYFIFKSS